MRLLTALCVSLVLHGIAYMVSYPASIVTGDTVPTIQIKRGKSALAVSFIQRKTESRKTAPADTLTHQSDKQITEQNSETDDTVSLKSGDMGVNSNVVFPEGSRPEYPYISTRRGEEGIVVLRLTISEEGRCTDVQIIQSSGYHRLDSAARSWALRKCIAQPALKNGKPVSSIVEKKIHFRLTDVQ